MHNPAEGTLEQVTQLLQTSAPYVAATGASALQWISSTAHAAEEAAKQRHEEAASSGSRRRNRFFSKADKMET